MKPEKKSEKVLTTEQLETLLEQLLENHFDVEEDLKVLTEQTDTFIAISGNAMEFNPNSKSDVEMTMNNLKELHKGLRMVHRALQGICSDIIDNRAMLEEIEISKLTSTEPQHK